MEIALGNGNVLVCPINREGRKGVILRQTDENRKVGDSGDDYWMDNESYVPSKEDVIIWLDNLEAIRVLQDAVNTAAIINRGYEVVDKTR